MIQVEQLGFAYAGRFVLQEVSLDLPPGCLAALVGPNGSGKTTLLKCIAGILKPTDGRVRVQDCPLTGLSLRQLARRLAYMPQGLDTAFPMTVFDLVLTGRRPHIAWRPSPDDLDVTWRVMDMFGVGDLATRYIDELSGGETQKVFLARAFAQQTHVMLLDEPTSNLDVFHQLEIMELLADAAHGQGKSILLALHDLNLAGRYVDRMILLRQGRVVADGPPAQVLTPENIRSVYRVEAAVHLDDDGLHVICSFPEKGA